MKRFASRLFAVIGLLCALVPLMGSTGCSKKAEPVPNANPADNADEGKGVMPGGPAKK